MRRAVFSILILLASVGLCAGGPGYSSSFFYTLSAGTITSSGVITGSNFVSTVATGTAPFASTSTTLCTNVNADRLDSLEASAFGQLAVANTWTAAHTFSKAVTDGTSVLALTGAWDVDTADEPHCRIGGESATWSTSGTGLGLNAPNGFAGNLIDGQVNGTIKFKIDSSGGITTLGGLSVSSVSKYTSGLYAGTGAADAKRMGFNFGASADPGSGYINYEGATADDYETTIGCVDPTDIDKLILFPNESGTVQVNGTANLTANDVTPSMKGARIWLSVANDGATALTDLDDPVVGQIYIIICNNATNPISIADSGNFALSAAWAPDTVGDNITLYVVADNNYIELARSNN